MEVHTGADGSSCDQLIADTNLKTRRIQQEEIWNIKRATASRFISKGDNNGSSAQGLKLIPHPKTDKPVFHFEIIPVFGYLMQTQVVSCAQE